MRVHACLDRQDAPACPGLALLPGRIAVQMHPKPQDVRGIQITDRRKARLRPMTASVLAVGPDVADGDRRLGCPITVRPGDTVLVHPQDGKRIEAFECGTFRASEEVRVYGVTAPLRGTAKRVPWWESVMASIDQEGRIRAHGKNVWLEIGEKRTESAGGIALPDSLMDRDDTGYIVSMGADCQELRGLAELGSKVLFNRRSLKQIELQGGRSYGLIEEAGIYGVVA